MIDEQKKPTEGVGICLACRYYYPLYGGPTLRFRRYAPGLAERGVRMRVFTQAVTRELIASHGILPNAPDSPTDSPADPRELWPSFQEIDGVEVHRTDLPGGWRRQFAYLSRLVRFCKERPGEIDVVQFHGLSVWAAPWIRQLRSLGVRTIMLNALIGELSSHPLKRKSQRLYWKVPFNLVDGVVVSTEIMAERLRGLGVSSRIEVIPNGVDLNRFQPVESEAQKAKLRRKLGMEPNWDVILAVGPVISRKGVDVLVEAFARIYSRHPSAHLILVGPQQGLELESRDGFHHKLRETITAADAQKVVHFVGSASNVEDYLKAADMLVFPSRREGMPNVPAEAMACGIPIIMTPFIGLPTEFGEPGVHYLKSNWNPEVLAADIEMLLLDHKLRQRLGREARIWVEQRLDVEKSMDNFATFYRDLAVNC